MEQYQEMYNKAILDNGITLEFVPVCYKTQEMFDKAVVNYPHTLKLVPHFYITQKSCALILIIL